MSAIIEHEGVKYRKVEREAVEGDKIVSNVSDDGFKVGGVFEVTGITSNFSGDRAPAFTDDNGDSRAFWRSERYAVLEPLANANTPHAMPKLTDAKPGDTVRITNANDIAKAFYKAGDTFEVALVWADSNGVDALDARGNCHELYAEEFEVVSPHSDSFGEQLAQSLEQAAQLVGDEKPANETQADSVMQPSHYTQGGVETIEYIEQVTAGYTDGFVAHCVGTAVKYVSRAPHKYATPTEDLRKAREYLNFAISRLEREA